jgi:3-phosphoshikimate 1-carboxyvinyltransferase
LLAVVGTQIPGGIAIRDASELRGKESDRVSSTVKNLRAMGAQVQELDDGLVVAGPQSLRGASIDSYGDHRIAMAFAVAALFAEGESEIVRAGCVNISFPQFFTVLDSLVHR